MVNQMDSEAVKLIFARANEFKEGDLLVGGTGDDVIRKDAKTEIAAMKIGDIAKLIFVEDAVSEVLSRSINRQLLNEMSYLTIGDVKAILTGTACSTWVSRYSDGLQSEVIAALVKTMSNDELSQVSRSIFNALPDNTPLGPVVVGSAQHFGSRIQPNSPGDSEDEILFSVLEGLTYGCGDVIIGLNPASDDIETIVRTERLLQSIVERLHLPTRYCVLSDMVKQSAAHALTKVDVGFQSLAGTSKALVGMLGLDVEGLVELSKGFNGLYFETGQGSEVTNRSAEGVDMVTLESRCYGLARYVRQQCHGKWMIVNDVAGFIGPEVFRTGRQLMRACLEDTVMAKLHGITMGLDVCSTFHMGIAPSELQILAKRIVSVAAPSYLMAVAGNADPMLGYLTTSYRNHPRLRAVVNKNISSAMQNRLTAIGAFDAEGRATGTAERTAALYARYMKEGGDTRYVDELTAEGLKKITTLQEKGCDLGYGSGPVYSEPLSVSTRLESLYRHARRALYTTLDSAVIRDCCPHYINVVTNSADREDYLAHPASGELLNVTSSTALMRLSTERTVTPLVQIVISDGLNADAVNENLRSILPRLRRSLQEGGFHTADIDVVIKNGRVRAGYHAAQILAPAVLVHFIGERPGTGLNQLSEYLTYGKDVAGNVRWNSDMDHSMTTAICSIHPRGKTVEAAIDDILICVKRMVEQRCSGVALGNETLHYQL